MREHGLHGRLRDCEHREERDIGAGRTRCRVSGSDRAVMRGGAPGLGVVTDKGVDAAAVGAAVRIPPRGVAQGQHVEGVEAHDRVDAVVVTAETVDQLRALYLLSGLTEET